MTQRTRRQREHKPYVPYDETLILMMFAALRSRQYAPSMPPLFSPPGSFAIKEVDLIKQEQQAAIELVKKIRRELVHAH